MNQLSLCHAGYRPDSPKVVSLCPDPQGEAMPERIRFFVRQNCFRMARQPGAESSPTDAWLPRGMRPLLTPIDVAASNFFYEGEMIRKETRWGVFWQGDFSEFERDGSYQIETDFDISAPFMIADWLYDRLARGYLLFLQAQRCGCEVPGIHPACHLDDGILDRDGSVWCAVGGWHDAGDFRKWLAFTQGNVEALAHLIRFGHPGFRAAALDEMRWGVSYFQAMMTEEGRVFEDVAGGDNDNRNYDTDWWFENHPGIYGDPRDNRWTDNVAGSGDERSIRTEYNPQVQFAFARTQAMAARCLPDAEGVRAASMARRAWDYGIRRGHDGRTLFLCEELMAALELLEWVAADRVRELVRELLARQETAPGVVSSFFLEKDGRDAYRSIAFGAHPAWALLRLLELRPSGMDAELEMACEAVRRYCDDYLVVDAGSNPFSLTPYGVFKHPRAKGGDRFRKVGESYGIRSFLPPQSVEYPHGTSSVALAHASVLAKAAVLLDRREWRTLAERQIQWVLGHNPRNSSLHSGIGYRQPPGYGFRITQLPEAMVTGFIGTPDDQPYLHTAFQMAGETGEYWDVPSIHLIHAVSWLSPQLSV